MKVIEINAPSSTKSADYDVKHGPEFPRVDTMDYDEFFRRHLLRNAPCIFGRAANEPSRSFTVPGEGPLLGLLLFEVPNSVPI